MDLAFTPEELAFRDEIRTWVHANLPKHISDKVHAAQRLTRDDMQTWAKILGKKGWLAPAIWRSGLERGAKAPVRRRMRPGRRAARRALRSGDGGARDHGVR